MRQRELADRVAERYAPRALRHYVKWKVRTDPAYAAVAAALEGSRAPVVDVGCGVGAMLLYLRESGLDVPLAGTDFDERKIRAGRDALRGVPGIDLRLADARTPLPEGHNVVLLDVLQYLGETGRRTLLANAASAAPPRGLVIVREGIRDASWRYRVTWTVDAVARRLRWMRAEQIDFPTREAVAGAFPGFDAEIRPLWGRTPFNNYLFVFRRRA